MKEKAKLFVTLLNLVLVGVVLFILFFRKDTQIVPVPTVKTLENRIETEKQLLPTYNTVIQKDKKSIDSLENKIDFLFSQLSLAKQKRDTVTIIKEQDSLILVLTENSILKDSVILNLEKTNSIRDMVIKNQDTLLAISKVDLKRVKRQRNLSILGNIILGTVIIFKK